ncbi:MAG: response regulator [Drouetiella hepatica Uher 2000/2452]|jgi:CheY-like chemotaxis protein|uniref:Response regulator n=1 Tax=Drouetiella hepatica Uher 2000/2452 TaxID=904376 RepID=A0A951QE98_9CYAN|nr:response regulator [Drouetiella hepatica Uher 2000/2452]
MENSHPCYILVVDDLADNLVLIKTLLEAEGHRVDVADSGALALAKIEASPPDLILLDLMMPDIDGFEVTRRLRQNDQFSSVPILIVTADRIVEEEQGLEIGANGFIRKPVDFDELLKKVEAFC